MNLCCRYGQKQGSSKVGKKVMKIRNHGAHERQTPHITLGNLGLTTSLLIVVLDLVVAGGGGKGPGWLGARGNEGLLFRSPRGGKRPAELEWRKSRECCLISAES